MPDIIIGVIEKKIRMLDDTLCEQNMCSTECDFYHNMSNGCSIPAYYVTCEYFGCVLEMNKFGQSLRNYECIKKFGVKPL